jgi:threonine dehydrogenase-like Zn-dependent dehydrogenase
MRALLFLERGRLDVIERLDPVPGPDDALIRVAGCGICGSDLSCYKTGVFAPQVLGHELAGIVAATGDRVVGLHRGDRVAVDPKIPCGECIDCASGASHRCVSALTRGLGASRPGGFAEYCVAPASCLHRLPPGVRVEDAGLAEPLSVALHGVSRAGISRGEPAVVIGLGPIGLLTVAALRARGAGSITGVEPVEARRALALSLGAAAALPPGDEARSACAGATFVAECSGRPEVLQEATDIAAPGGRVLLLGMPMERSSVTPLAWLTREITIFGSVASSEAEFDEALGLMAREPSIAGIITRRVTLAEAPRAFESLLAPSGDGKVMVVPE